MPRSLLRPALLCAALIAAASLPARADSLVSSASGAGSASSASVSDSFEASSDGSSKARDAVAGDYRVVDVADAAGRPGTLRVTLQPLADAAAAPFVLYLPRQAVAGAPLAAGERVQARERDYGYEFRRGEATEPFFLALHDERQRELAPRAVTL